VAQDDMLAYMWVTLALSQIDPESPDYSNVSEFHDFLASQLSTGQKAEAQRQALEWEKQHRQ
jgi:hypothetical protein